MKGRTGTPLTTIITRPRKVRKSADRSALIRDYHVPARIVNDMTHQEILDALQTYRSRSRLTHNTP